MDLLWPPGTSKLRSKLDHHQNEQTFVHLLSKYHKFSPNTCMREGMLFIPGVNIIFCNYRILGKEGITPHLVLITLPCVDSGRHLLNSWFQCSGDKVNVDKKTICGGAFIDLQFW